MQPATIFVLLVLALLIFGLVRDRMRPGMILFSGAVAFMAVGILQPREMLEGFSNKGMITVAMLFLVSEGVRRSGLLEDLLRRLLPSKNGVGVSRLQARLLPFIASISAFLNNTPVVVIFAPMVKRWAESVKMAPTKLLIPLSYATILGGMCTLIGTSTNLVVHGMVLDSGHRGFTMFELGQIGVPITIVGILYLVLASKYLLPDSRPDSAEALDDETRHGAYHKVEVVLGARFPAINRRLANFDFKTKYGATIVEIKRGGNSLTRNLHNERFHEGDTLVLLADDSIELRRFWQLPGRTVVCCRKCHRHNSRRKTCQNFPFPECPADWTGCRPGRWRPASDSGSVSDRYSRCPGSPGRYRVAENNLPDNRHFADIPVCGQKGSGFDRADPSGQRHRHPTAVWPV